MSAILTAGDGLAYPPARTVSPGWRQSLAHGAAGTLLLHIERARAGVGDWATAHRWAAATTADPISAGDGCGLFAGAPAVAYVLHGAGHPAYAAPLRALDDAIAAPTRHRLRQAHARMDAGQLPMLREYDLVSGLTGIGCHLLRRHPAGPEIRHVLAYLVRLTEPVTVRGRMLPGWWTGNGPTDQPSPSFPGGHGNLGLAHGITGPLALLALAAARGVTVPGQAGAIVRIGEWADRWRPDRGRRAWWPPWVTWHDLHVGRTTTPAPSRPSWCYGTPGQARAHQLAGLAIGDVTRQRDAEEALAGCVADDRQLAQLSEPTLCHGWAGLVHTVWRAAQDATTGELAALLPSLRDRLGHQPARPGRDGGLLDGTAGLALVHTAATGEPPQSGWDACLLTGGEHPPDSGNLVTHRHPT
jgi:hypothetical protein